MKPIVEPAQPDDLSPEQAERLLRYCAGKASAQERAVVERWIAADVRHADTMARLQATWTATAVDPTENERYDVEAALASAHQRWTRRPAETSKAPSHAGRQPALRRTRGLAWSEWTSRHWALGVGGVCTALAVAVGIYRATPSSLARPTIYRTAIAQRAMVTLADGSHVMLAPQTMLTVSSSFAKGAREVTLDGEAYFEVKPDARAPFVVRTGTARAQVLGTAFDIRYYTGEREVRIAVLSGRVAVQPSAGSRIGGRHATVLASGMVARLRNAFPDSVDVITHGMTATDYSAWTSGQLVFHDAPMSDVLAAVGRWYGYEFRMADSSLATRRITVTLGSQSLPDVMNFFKTMLGVSLTFDGPGGRVVTLHARRVTSRDERLLQERMPRTTLRTQSTEVGR